MPHCCPSEACACNRACSGAFGTVFLGLNNDTGELLAVKEVTVIEGEKGQEAVQQLEQEVRSSGCSVTQVSMCVRLSRQGLHS